MSGTNNAPPWTATVHFTGNSTVGLTPRGYLLEIPHFRQSQTGQQDEEDRRIREEAREIIREMYASLDGEQTPMVTFSDEPYQDRTCLTDKPCYFADLIGR